jgi:Flp pilus assembly protein TadB
MPINTLAVFCLVAAAFGGVAYVFLYPILSGEKRAESRRLGITQSDVTTRKAAARVGAPKIRPNRSNPHSRNSTKSARRPAARRWRRASRRPACRGKSALSSFFRA